MEMKISSSSSIHQGVWVLIDCCRVYRCVHPPPGGSDVVRRKLEREGGGLIDSGSNIGVLAGRPAGWQFVMKGRCGRRSMLIAR